MTRLDQAEMAQDRARSSDSMSEDRARSPYSAKEKALRLVWSSVGQTTFRLTFHNWYGARRVILRMFGARVGSRVRVRRTVRIEIPWNLEIGENSSVGDRAVLYCLGPVRLGRNVSVSQGAHLCAGTHDYNRPDMRLLRLPIVIENHAWIAADAFVGPDIRVGEGAILGARGCAFKDLDAWTIYGGNPARTLGPRPRIDIAAEVGS